MPVMDDVGSWHKDASRETAIDAHPVAHVLEHIPTGLRATGRGATRVEARKDARTLMILLVKGTEDAS